MTTYADQRAHDVAWMTAAEREEYGRRLAAVDAQLTDECPPGVCQVVRGGYALALLHDGVCVRGELPDLTDAVMRGTCTQCAVLPGYPHAATCPGGWREPAAEQRALVQAGRELIEIGGELCSPVVCCGTCGYVSPATWRAPLHCPSCARRYVADDLAPVMGETLMTADEYRAAVNAFVATLASA